MGGVVDHEVPVPRHGLRSCRVEIDPGLTPEDERPGVLEEHAISVAAEHDHAIARRVVRRSVVGARRRRAAGRRQGRPGGAARQGEREERVRRLILEAAEDEHPVAGRVEHRHVVEATHRDVSRWRKLRPRGGRERKRPRRPGRIAAPIVAAEENHAVARHVVDRLVPGARRRRRARRRLERPGGSAREREGPEIAPRAAGIGAAKDDEAIPHGIIDGGMPRSRIRRTSRRSHVGPRRRARERERPGVVPEGESGLAAEHDHAVAHGVVDGAVPRARCRGSSRRRELGPGGARSERERPHVPERGGRRAAVKDHAVADGIVDRARAAARAGRRPRNREELPGRRPGETQLPYVVLERSGEPAEDEHPVPHRIVDGRVLHARGRRWEGEERPDAVVGRDRRARHEG